MIADDEPGMLEWLSVLLEQKGYEVSIAASAAKALEAASGRVPDVAVVDLRMPGMDGIDLLAQLRKLNPELVGIVMTAFSSIETAVRAMREGAADYLIKPFDMESLLSSIQRGLREKQILSESRRLRRQVESDFDFSEIVGRSDAMLELLEQVRAVADKESTVLITGESGTGKELVARAIHFNSHRSGGPFMAVNCGSFTQTLLESELFGHVKGSFTGAHRDKTGLLAAASGGSFFLDEVGELDRELQVKLLRALQERQVLPVGGTRPVPFDVRLIAATNSDLKAKVERGEFRADLYYRLNVIPLRVPPLRDRRNDIPLLVERFARLNAAKFGAPLKQFTPGAMELLRMYPWPGNVRELENLVERLCVMIKADTIREEDLPELVRTGRGRDTGIPKAASDPIGEVEALPATLLEIEKAWLYYVLEHRAGGQKKLAARLLGIDESTLHRKLERYARDKEG